MLLSIHLLFIISYVHLMTTFFTCKVKVSQGNVQEPLCYSRKKIPAAFRLFLKGKIGIPEFFCTNFLSYALLRLTLSEKQVKRL